MKKQGYDTKSFLRKKFYPALAMLLVASTMMVSTTYAWFVLSTAPEITGIQTQVGANGSLEMALLNQESWNDLSRLDMGDIDESGTASATDINLTWGNLVNLGDPSYGMDKIVLNPARLYLMENGEEEGTPSYKVNGTILKTPVYGEDGRILKLNTTDAVAYVYHNNQFSQPGYGVRAIGTAASMSVFQLGLNSAQSLLSTNMTAARTRASNALSQNGGDLANIVMQYALDKKESGYTVEDVRAVRSLAEGMRDALESIESALRNVFAGYITLQGSGVTQENYQQELEWIQYSGTTLAQMYKKYETISTIIPDMSVYINKLSACMSDVDGAITACDAKIETGGTFTWAEISAIVRPLADTDKMTVSGKTITALKAEIIKDGAIDYTAALALVQGGIEIGVPTGSGLLSDISDFAGDYSAAVTVKNVAVSGNNLGDINVKMTTASTVIPPYLKVCGNALRAGDVTEAVGSAALTDFYGYALDLAFRTNAQTSDLLLQTEPENRVYEDDTQNTSLQGGGSYMSFITTAGLSATKMVKLMGGIRVVFMDEEQVVLAVAQLDCGLGKDVYTVLSTEEQASTGKYAYLNGGAGGYQRSDLINETEYTALPATSNVTFDNTTGRTRVTAKLYLYGFSMAKNDAGNNTGGMAMGSKATDAVITPLEQDTVQQVTAVVYLDGSVVNNSMVAANSAQSMTGTLNLQFASSATLIPAENTALRRGSETNAGETNAGETNAGGTDAGDGA